MKKKRVLAALGLLAFIGIVLGVLALLPPRPSVTKANFDRIKVGMREEDVSAIFGRHANEVIPFAGGSIYIWNTEDQSLATVELDLDFRVYDFGWRSIPPETILERIRRWLHLD
jgi:hypothetical protein